MTLPDFSNLNKSIGSFLSSKRSCCSTATCIYVKTTSLHPPIAETEYLRQLHADNHGYRIHRRKRNTRARRAARADEDVRAAERSRDRSARRTARGEEDTSAAERSLDRSARHAKRLKVHQHASVSHLINDFHLAVSNGPVYVCSSCDQLLYRHSVQKAAGLRSFHSTLIHKCLLGTVSPDGIEYVCQTCFKYIKQGKLPPCSLSNGLDFPPIPSNRQVLSMAEWRTLSPRLPFMRIHEAVVGKQLRIHGNLVFVPADVSTTVSMLPRTSSEMETVSIKLKRKSQYHHAFLTANIRPECVRRVSKYLVEYGPLFKKENISLSDETLDSLQSPDSHYSSGSWQPASSAISIP
jgi:hypothetical protein